MFRLICSKSAAGIEKSQSGWTARPLSQFLPARERKLPRQIFRELFVCIIAPRMTSNDGNGCKDKLDINEVSWTCNGANRSTAGGPAMGNDKIFGG
jgi:hypothetical protein